MQLFSTVARIFPPPDFMTLPNLGVDISDASLKYIQFHRKGSHLALVQWGDLPIPQDTVKRGDLTNKTALVAVLTELKKRTAVPYVRISLPEERAYLFETTIPRATATRNVRSALESRLEENVPISPRDAFFDYTIVSMDHESRELRVSVAVYARDTIEGYYEACREAGLVPLSFEVEAQAIARATTPVGNKGTYMIVDFGQTRTGVGIVHQGSLMFTSTIDIGGAQLSDALRQHMGQAEESEYTRIKNEQGLLRNGSSDAYTALLAPIAALKDELNMRISYWNVRGENIHERSIQKIVLCGGSANVAGLPEYLAEELDIVTERALVWQNAFSFEEVVPVIGRRYSYGYATAIGLALTDFVPHV